MNKNNRIKLDLQFFAGNTDLINKAGVTTTGTYGTSGLMPAKTAEIFIKDITEDTTFLGKMRTETVGTKEGTIPKIGVGSRLLRNHTEGKDNITGNEVVPQIRDLKYENKYMTLGTSLTEEWIEQNIEKEGFERKFLGMIAEQERADILDLAFNGDEAILSSEQDAAFLQMNDGFIKQIKAGGNVFDNTGNTFNDNLFFKLKLTVPTKYVKKSHKWICSLTTYTELLNTLKARNTSLGDQILLNGDDINILGHGFDYSIPNFPDDVIIFAEPKNLTVTFFVNIYHLKTKEGKEAIYERKRFYATHLAADFIIQEVKATGIAINRGVAAVDPILVSSN